MSTAINNTLSDKTKSDLSDLITINFVQQENFKSFTQDKTNEEQSLYSKLRTLKTEYLKKKTGQNY